MFSTVETRWFGTGEIPAQLLTWFDACPGRPDIQPQRQDHYLRSVEGDALGIKVRDGGLEIKQRQRVYGSVRLHPAIVGRIESWIKWRFSLNTTGLPFSTNDIGDPHWLSVRKERRLRQYRVDTGGRVQPLPPGTIVDAACEVELTRITAGGRLWWTVAFESFGRDAGNYDQLLRVARHLSNLGGVPTLSAAGSFGYPYWLSTISDA